MEDVPEKTASQMNDGVKRRDLAWQLNAAGCQCLGLIITGPRHGARRESQRDSVSEPKVARAELPWENVARSFTTPRGLWPGWLPPSPVTKAATPVGLIIDIPHSPRVARASQPWALRHNPFGILQLPPLLPSFASVEIGCASRPDESKNGAQVVAPASWSAATLCRFPIVCPPVLVHAGRHGKPLRKRQRAGALQNLAAPRTVQEKFPVPF
jgi:hypothetical protein